MAGLCPTGRPLGMKLQLGWGWSPRLHPAKAATASSCFRGAPACAQSNASPLALPLAVLMSPPLGADGSN